MKKLAILGIAGTLALATVGCNKAEKYDYDAFEEVCGASSSFQTNDTTTIYWDIKKRKFVFNKESYRPEAENYSTMTLIDKKKDGNVDKAYSNREQKKSRGHSPATKRKHKIKAGENDLDLLGILDQMMITMHPERDSLGTQGIEDEKNSEYKRREIAKLTKNDAIAREDYKLIVDELGMKGLTELSDSTYIAWEKGHDEDNFFRLQYITEGATDTAGNTTIEVLTLYDAQNLADYKFANTIESGYIGQGTWKTGDHESIDFDIKKFFDKPSKKYEDYAVMRSLLVKEAKEQKAFVESIANGISKELQQYAAGDTAEVPKAPVTLENIDSLYHSTNEETKNE